MISAIPSIFGWHYFVESSVALLLVVVLYMVARSTWRHYRVYFAFRKVPCDPDMHIVFGHALRCDVFHCMLGCSICAWLFKRYLKTIPGSRWRRDMGAALDWIVELTKTNGWKSMRMCYGPTINQFLAVHPDTARIVLQKGDKTIMQKRTLW